MVRPCAKFLAQNCYAPTKNTDGKTPSDIFYVGLLTCARRGPIWAWFVYGKTAKANAPRHRAFVSSQKIQFHHKFVSVWIKRVFVFECEANANNFDNFADIACVWARNMLK